MRGTRMDIAAIQSAVRDAQTALRVAGHAAWAYVQEREPELAQAMRDLGWSNAAAGEWLVTHGDTGLLAPIDVVASGRTPELIAAIHKSQHGIF